jgi:transcriptional regulator with XRE-family HTH domain
VLGFSLDMDAFEIRSFRKRKGWTQSELAAKLGTDAVTVSRWERGIVRPRPSAQVRLVTLKDGLSDEIRSLVDAIGASDSQRTLKRLLLLRHAVRPHRFIDGPKFRLEEADRALRQQSELKTKIRLKR